MHTFPQLRKLEQKYGDKVVIVGVHSPKFPAERDTANLREAVLRYRIEHPVVNDRDFKLWQAFGGRAWPTLVFIDPQGRVIGKHEGELPFSEFDPLVDGMLAEFEARGLLQPGQAQFGSLVGGAGPMNLSSPWDVVKAGSRLYVAMAGSHQVCSLDLESGRMEAFAGSGREGLQDGSRDQAWFAQPSGLALLDNTLYVADSEVSAVRAIDLETGTVSTLVGEGLFVFGDEDGDGRSARL